MKSLQHKRGFTGISLFLTVSILFLCFGYRASSETTDEVYPDYYNPSTPIYDDYSNETGGCESNMIECDDVCKPKCDNKIQCKNCEDELNCYEDSSNFSRVFKCRGDGCVWLGSKCPPDDNLQCQRFCDGVNDCADDSDEPRLGFGFKCPINPSPLFKRERIPCTIPQEYIKRWKDVKNIEDFRDYAICSDQADICYTNGELDIARCFQCLDGTVISKVQLCDKKIDCMDMSDECLCEEKMGDGGREHLLAFCNSQHSTSCVGKLSCGGPDAQCIAQELLCDEMVDCNNGADEMFCHKNGKDTGEKCPGSTGLTYIACDGVIECQDRIDECNPNCQNPPGYCNFNFSFGDHIDGCINMTPNKATICDGIQDCQNGMDEEYCPSRTLCNENGTFEGSYENFQRCDFVTDCKINMADEKDCENHFYCENGSYIRWSQVRDKIFDCEDGEDECQPQKADSFSEDQYMIRHPLLLGIMWIMALMALIGNLIVIVITLRDLMAIYRRGTSAVTGRVGACNKTLVLNLAIADFLMGVYLIVLDIKAWQYSGNYCRHAEKWVTSSLCTGLGTIALLSSQASVLIMVMMTTYRLYSVKSPFTAEKLKVRYLVIFVICGWIPPVLVAFYPLLGYDNYAGFSLTSGLPYFNDSFVDKPQFENFVSKAWQISEYSNGANLENRDWDSLLKTFCRLYPEVCNRLISRWYGYYSSESVCLPRLFPHPGEGGWIFTVVVISFDFLAFLYILMAYMLMCKFTVTGYYESRSGTFRGASFSSVDELRSREDRVIWQRISRLLITDFLCWVPICITCLVSLSGVDIPPVLYQVSAIVLLPINSAVNPLLYSNAINTATEKFCTEFLRCNRGNYTCLCKRLRGSGTHTPPSGIRIIGATAASATDELRSGDQLGMTSLTETRSITMSETDRSRLGAANSEGRHLISPRSVSVSQTENGVQGDIVPPIRRLNPRNNIARSMAAKMSRFFSERNRQEAQTQEPGAVIYRRPKSQSTTSTSTTFTTMAPEE